MNAQQASTVAYRVVERVIATGLPGHPGRTVRDHMTRSLSDARPRIVGARRAADFFHSYEFTARDGTRMHVACARRLPGHNTRAPAVDLTTIYEITTEALAAAFGLTPTA